MRIVQIFTVLVVGWSLSSVAIAKPKHEQFDPKAAYFVTHFDRIPNFVRNPTLNSAKSGRWSDSSTWQEERLPGADDIVLIGPQHEILIDEDTALAKTVGIYGGGALVFVPTTHTLLSVATLMVLPGGSLQMGTPEQPVVSDKYSGIVFTDTALDADLDPQQFSNGLIVIGGRVTMHGERKTPFARALNEPTAGTTRIQLENAQNWSPGDDLFIPDTRPAWSEQLFGPRWGTSYRPQWEWRVLQDYAPISSIAIDLDRPLSYNHTGARDTNGNVTFLPHVANVTRNVWIVSATDNPATRGHTFFTADAIVDIQNAGFYGLGRTTIRPLNSMVYDSGSSSYLLQRDDLGHNQIGRYSVHFHHLEALDNPLTDGCHFIFDGNVVLDSPKLGIAIHDSHNGCVRRNVVLLARGSALMTEDGSERGNIIAYNFLGASEGSSESVECRFVRCYGIISGDPGQDFAHEGGGYWGRGSHNYIIGNVAVNSSIAGFQFFQFADDNRNSLPFAFEDNESYGSAIGFDIWAPGAGHFSREVYRMSRSVVWNVGDGISIHYPEGYIEIDDLIATGYQGIGTGYNGANQANQTKLNNPLIQNFYHGARFIPGDGWTEEEQGVFGGTLRNKHNVAITHFHVSPEVMAPRNIVLRNINFATPDDEGATHISLHMVPAAWRENFIRPDVISVINSYFDGKAGVQNHRLYYTEQHPDWILPQTQGDVIGSPEAGLTNAENWQRYRIAFAGAVAACLESRTDLGITSAFVCPPQP